MDWMLISIIIVTSVAIVGIIITWSIASKIRRQAIEGTYKPKAKKENKKNDK